VALMPRADTTDTNIVKLLLCIPSPCAIDNARRSTMRDKSRAPYRSSCIA